MMTNPVQLLGRAAGEAAHAVERVRIAGPSDARLSLATGAIVRHIDTAATLTTQASDMLSRPLDDAVVPQAIGRGLDALASAAVRLLDAKAGPILGAATRLYGIVDGAAKIATSEILTGIPGLSLPESISSLSPLAGPNAALFSPAAVGGSPHLLVLIADRERFFFGLSTAAFDKLRRQTQFNVAAQERLQRLEALQAVNKGGETLSVSGAVFTAWKGGARQIETLRRIGLAMKPIELTTGYGDVLGRWYMTQIEEEQEALLSNGAPRKQTFSLEFRRYGDDYQNL